MSGASKELKEAGVPGGVRQAARMCGKDEDTILNWHKDNYQLFCIIKIGCVGIINSNKPKNKVDVPNRSD